MKIAVIGNGIIGSLTALMLAKSNRSFVVSLWGQAHRPMAGSMAAAAMLNSYAEIDRHTFATESGRQKFNHSRLAAKQWPMLDNDLLGGVAFRSGGLGTYVLRSRTPTSIEDENWTLIRDALIRNGENFEIGSPNDVPGYLPRRGYEASEVLWIPDEGWMDPLVVMGTIGELIEATPNIETVAQECARISQETKVVVETREKEPHEYDHVIVAAGFRSFELLRDFLPDNPLSPRGMAGEGVTVRLRVSNLTQRSVIRTPNRGLACGLYAAPYNNELVVGASNRVTREPCGLPDLESVRSILSMASNELNSDLYLAGVTRINYGVRPMTSDGFPLVGWVSEKIFVITGTRRDGWHMAPLLAQHALNTVVSPGTPDASMHIYSPTRRAYQFLSISDAVDEAVAHYLSGLEQHGYQAPYGSYGRQISQNYRAFFEKLHSDLRCTHGIPVDMISDAIKIRDQGLPYPN